LGGLARHLLSSKATNRRFEMLCATECGVRASAAPLIRGRLTPASIVRASLPHPGASRQEINAALTALDEGLDTRERTVNAVVERMLAELTW
jgi:hypothetical protein